jgi:TctA family transporter
MSQGRLSILLRPIPCALLIAAALLLAIPLFRKLNALRVRVLDREEA